MRQHHYLALSILLSVSAVAVSQRLDALESNTAQPRAIQPFTMTQKTTVVQKLADGTTITRISILKEAHDSQGRTYRQSQVDTGGGPARNKITTFNVMDPVEHVTLTWSSQNKLVTKFHLPEPRPRPVKAQTSPPAVIAGIGSGAVAGGVMGGITESQPPPILRTLPDTSNLPKTKRERLDGKTIAGVYAEGIRITTTYPIDYFGNDRPIVTMRETWTSPELRMTVLSVDDDPRTGVRTVEVTDLSRGEPDLSVFQAPEGYTVKEINPVTNGN